MIETEKVELTEQTPLKADTDPPAGAAETVDVEVTKESTKEEKIAKQPRKWFFSRVGPES